MPPRMRSFVISRAIEELNTPTPAGDITQSSYRFLMKERLNLPSIHLGQSSIAPKRGRKRRR